MTNSSDKENSYKDIKNDLNLADVKPYGDTMNDGKVQLSFTLPIKNNEKAGVAAKNLVKKMGFSEISVVHQEELDEGFTFFIVYGASNYSIDYTKIKVDTIEMELMSKNQVNSYIKDNIGRKIIAVGATTGSDAHTVGIDAIMNMKGFSGHKGLESYEMIEAYNLGPQVPNEEFVRRAIELEADIMLVSQVVTQKDIHIKNLTNLVELLEAEGLRDKVVLICGGPRITNQLAKEMGYDAGFGPGTYAAHVATYSIKELVKRNLI